MKVTKGMIKRCLNTATRDSNNQVLIKVGNICKIKDETGKESEYRVAKVFAKHFLAIPMTGPARISKFSNSEFVPMINHKFIDIITKDQTTSTIEVPSPKPGDKCLIEEEDGALHEHIVLSVTPKRFSTMSCSDSKKIYVGIDKLKFQPVAGKQAL